MPWREIDHAFSRIVTAEISCLAPPARASLRFTSKLVIIGMKNEKKKMGSPISDSKQRS